MWGIVCLHSVLGSNITNVQNQNNVTLQVTSTPTTTAKQNLGTTQTFPVTDLTEDVNSQSVSDKQNFFYASLYFHLN